MQVGVDAAIQKRHAADLDPKPARGVPRQDLLGDRDPVVVDDEVGARHAVPLPEGKHEVGLLYQAVVVVGRLVGIAEAEEIEGEGVATGGDCRPHAMPVPG